MRPGGPWLRWVLLIGLLLGGPGLAQDSFFNAAGYRDQHYRRPTPARAPAGRLVDTDELRALMDTADPVLLDVQAISVRPELEEFGLSWLPNATRMHIAGSTWLPNVGYGALDERMTHFFRSNLERLSEGDKDRALVFYCVVDCWMSWNAVRRAAAWGYRNLYWYPGGTDSWSDAGLPLVAATPEPLSPLPASAQSTFFRDYAALNLAAVADEAWEDDKDILLFFETEDCQFCLRMRRSVLNDTALIARLNEDFIAISIDIASDAAMRDRFGQSRPVSDVVARDYRVVGTPTMVFLDADLELLHRHSGLIANPREMGRLLDFVETRAYDEEPWQTFKRR